MPRRALLLLLAVLHLPDHLDAQATPPATPLPSVTLPPDLDVVLRAYEREWQARSAAGLAALFTEDGFVLQGGRPPVRGRGAIEQAYRGAGGPLSLRALSYAVGEDVGYIVGGYAMAPGSADVGKFILLLRREPGGRWLIAADMDNGNTRD